MPFWFSRAIIVLLFKTVFQFNHSFHLKLPQLTLCKRQNISDNYGDGFIQAIVIGRILINKEHLKERDMGLGVLQRQINKEVIEEGWRWVLPRSMSP